MNLSAGRRRPTPPLVAAIRAKNLEMVNLLLASGADVNAADRLNQTPLIKAAEIPEEMGVPLIHRLLEIGADIERSDKWGCTAVYCAVFHKHPTAVEVLAKAGADMNRFYEAQKGTLLQAAQKRVDHYQREIDDPAQPEWIRKEAKEGLQKWAQIAEVLRRVGATR